MEESYIQTLELTKVLERLASHAAFSVSQEKALALRPSDDMVEVLRRQSAAAEARRLLDLKPNFTIGGARDIRQHLQRASIGAVLMPDELLLVASTAASGRIVRGTISKLADQLPSLDEVTLPIRSHDEVEGEIRQAISDSGEVLDAASTALAQIRQELRRAHERLISKLNEIVSSPAYRQALQEPIVTQRQGRYVVPVKAEFKGQVKGIVHDQSASGATVFMEPLVVVDLANRWRQAQVEEEQEVERILRRLSGLVGRDAEQLSDTLAAIAEVDLFLSQAKLAEAMKATTPALVDLRSRPAGAPVVMLRKARHPLLTGEVVPIGMELGADFDVLVITGPNTGGKTVALKTVGLLCLMAQCGMQIPADEGSSVAVFRTVYADIGDEQSIEQSLSTFSSHVTRIVDILRKADDRCLVLLDELGAGTDPQEGSALARAILTHLLERHIPTVATTHYSELKSYAHTTPRVENASVEFDLETLSPTYKLSIGLPGRSNALAIATRLGMDAAVIETARELLAPGEVEIEALLSQIQMDRDEARAARAEADRLRQEARNQRARINAEMEALEDRKYEVLEKARAQSEQELASLRGRVQQVTRELERAKLQAAAEAMRTVEAAAGRAETLRPVRAPKPRPQHRVAPSGPLELKLGQPVYVATLQKVGTLSSLPDDRGEVEVQVGMLRTRVKTRDLARTDATASEPEREPEITYRLDTDRAGAVSIQIDLRGKRVDEAEEELDSYLNDAYLAGLKVVRIIHGKGTGAVRQVVRDHLAGSPLVRHFEAAGDREGGEGVTVASLAN
ncbi:MAG TPA: endonuclease MutS2 [Chloroflexota bacterium]